MRRRWGLAAIIGALLFAESDGSDSDSGSSSSSDSDGSGSDSGDVFGASYVSDSSSSSDGNDAQTATGRKRRSGEPGATHDMSSSDLHHLRYGDPDAADDHDSGDSGSDGGGDDGGDGGGE